MALLLAGCVGITSRSAGPLTADLPQIEAAEIQAQGDTPSKICPVTQPPSLAFNPPEPYSADPPFASEFWYGSPTLWTLLPLDGTWRDLPYSEKTGYTNKVLFWREGYDPSLEPQPDLTLSGVHLDGDGETFKTDEATNAMAADISSAMLVGVDIPAPGCWKFTASYKGEDLSFTLLVQP